MVRRRTGNWTRLSAFRCPRCTCWRDVVASTDWPLEESTIESMKLLKAHALGYLKRRDDASLNLLAALSGHRR